MRGEILPLLPLLLLHPFIFPYSASFFLSKVTKWQSSALLGVLLCFIIIIIIMALFFFWWGGLVAFGVQGAEYANIN